MNGWRDTPPTKAGRYRAKHRKCGTVVDAEFDGEWWFGVGKYGKSLRTKEAAELVQFGHRIPTNSELAELPGLVQQFGKVCQEYGRFDAGDDGAAILKKINAILGVADESGAD